MLRKTKKQGHFFRHSQFHLSSGFLFNSTDAKKIKGMSMCANHGVRNPRIENG